MSKLLVVMSQLSNASLANLCRVLVILAAVQLAGCGSAEQRAQGYYERGIKLLEQQEYVKANLELRNAVRLKRDLLGAWRGLAQIEERNRNFEALAGTLRTIVELDPNDLDSRVRLGRLLLYARAFEPALKVIDAAPEAANKHAGALAIKAAIFLRLDDPIGAVREAKAALEIDPTNTEAVLVLAAERVQRGDLDGALRFSIVSRSRTSRTSVSNCSSSLFLNDRRIFNRSRCCCKGSSKHSPTR